MHTDQNPNTEKDGVELSVVMPCLNEHRTLGTCIEKALLCMKEHGIEGEVIVADNGSDDGSIEIAQDKGARVVNVAIRGYGAALFEGIASARGRFVIMGDADDTYDFSSLKPFVEKLREGYDLVVGNRFKGGIEAGAMPPTHRYFGNPLLSALGRFLFRCPQVGDFYCGLRGFRKEAVDKISVQSTGMEFALEMIVKAGIHGLSIAEVPTTLSRDVKDRVPHLRTYRDGWRSLRFFLTMSPHWLFSLPGAALAIVGALASLLLFFGELSIGGITFDYHTLIFTSGAAVIGYQGVLLGSFCKLIQTEVGLHPIYTKLAFLRRRSVLERGLAVAAVLAGSGLAIALTAVWHWYQKDFGNLRPDSTIRLTVASVFLLILASQTFFAAFFLGTINLLAERRQRFKQSSSAPG